MAPPKTSTTLLRTGGSRIKAYKLLFSKIEEFQQSASEEEKILILEKIPEFFKFLCDTYHPKYEDAQGEVKEYDATFFQEEVHEFVLLNRCRRKIHKAGYLGITKLFYYAQNAVTQKAAGSIMGEATDEWPAHDFPQWFTPPLSRELAPSPESQATSLHSVPLSVDQDQGQIDSPEPQADPESPDQPAEEVPKYRTRSSVAVKKANAESRHQPGSGASQSSPIHTLNEASKRTTRSTVTLQDGQSNLTDIPQPGRKRKHHETSLLETSYEEEIRDSTSPDPEITYTAEPSKSPQLSPGEIGEDSVDLHSRTLPDTPSLTHIVDTMERMYVHIRNLAVQYYEDHHDYAELRIVASRPSNLSDMRDVSPDLELLWELVFGKNLEILFSSQEHERSNSATGHISKKRKLDGPSEGWASFDSRLNVIDMLQSVLGVFMSYTFFLGKEDMSSWSTFPRATEGELEGIKASMLSAILPSLHGNEALAQLHAERFTLETKKLNGGRQVSSLSLRYPPLKDPKEIVPAIAERLIQIIKPHTPLFYEELPAGKKALKKSPLEYFRGDLHKTMLAILRFSQQLDPRNEQYRMTWFKKGDSYNDISMTPIGGHPYIDQGAEHEVLATVTPAISVYDSRLGHTYVARARVHVVYTPPSR